MSMGASNCVALKQVLGLSPDEAENKTLTRASRKYLGLFSVPCISILDSDTAGILFKLNEKCSSQSTK